MGILKKAAAVSTLGMSVVAEKSVKAAISGTKLAAQGIAGKVETQADLSEEDLAAGVLFRGMSHESGRNATVTLYGDRIERIQERSRLSVSAAKQQVEVTPIRTISSVKAEKDGQLFTEVTIYATGNEIEFKFKHDHADLFRRQIQELILQYGQPVEAPMASTEAAPDHADQLRKVAELRDAGILSEEEFAAKKAEILARM